MKRLVLSFALLVAATGLGSSCATSSSITLLGEEAIQRKETLPDGVSAWRPVYGKALEKEEDSNTLIFPFAWEHGFTERLTLVWMPLPFQFKYLLVDKPGFWWVADLALLGPIQARSDNFHWRPTLRFPGRYGLNSRLALDGELFLQAEVKRGVEYSFSRSLGVRMGALIQALPWLGLTGSAWVLNEHGITLTRYLGGTPPSNHGAVAFESSRWRFPLTLRTTITPHRRFEIRLDLEYYRLGYEEGFTGLPAYLSVAYYW